MLFCRAIRDRSLSLLNRYRAWERLGRTPLFGARDVQNQQVDLSQHVTKPSWLDDLHVLDICECILQFGSSAVVRITCKDPSIRMQAVELVCLGAASRTEIDDHFRIQSSGQIHRHRRNPILNASTIVLAEVIRESSVGTFPYRVGPIRLDHVDGSAGEAVCGANKRGLPADRSDPTEDEVVTQRGLHSESDRGFFRKDRLGEQPCFPVLERKDVPVKPPLGGSWVILFETFPSQTDDRTEDSVDETACSGVGSLLGPVDGFVHRGMIGNRFHQENLSRTRQKHASDLRVDVSPGTFQTRLEQMLEGAPSCDGAELQRSGKGSVPLIESLRLLSLGFDRKIRKANRLSRESLEHDRTRCLYFRIGWCTHDLAQETALQ